MACFLIGDIPIFVEFEVAIPSLLRYNKRSMKEEIPILYTFFLDGKQIEAYWNGEKLTTFIKLIHPGESMRIEVALDNISKGIHNLYLGHVKHPERIYWPDTDDLSDTAFMISPIATVLYDDAAHQTIEDFPHLHEK